MAYQDPTAMGGARETFLTTHWTLIDQVKSGQDKDRALIGLLLDRYWKPVYCYLRRKGHDNEQAKDLTQGFFHEVVLNRELVHKADPSRGRFRSLLLVALNRYVINVRQSQTARTRIPPDKLVPLDMIAPPELPQTVTESTPEDCYNYAWLSALLDQVLSEVEAGCHLDSLATHWQVFYARVVQPSLTGSDAPSLEDLRRKHDIKDEKTVSNMVITVKRRFRSTLEQHIRNTVVSENLLEEELAEIMQFLPKGAQPC
jgi:DNA-directed RNA polymerase specialized sigma24 family protein